MQSVSLALVSQQPFLLEGLSRILGEHQHLVVIAKGSSALAIGEICSLQSPTILIVDPSHSRATFDAFAAVGQVANGPKIIVISCDASVDFAIHSLDAGASAFLLTTCTTDELLQAIEAVLAGETYISASMTTKVITAFRVAALRKAASAAAKLSAREGQIVSLLKKGRTNKQIALELGLSEKTIKHYMSVLMQKLQAKNRLEVAMSIHEDEPSQMNRRKTDSM